MRSLTRLFWLTVWNYLSGRLPFSGLCLLLFLSPHAFATRTVEMSLVPLDALSVSIRNISSVPQPVVYTLQAHGCTTLTAGGAGSDGVSCTSKKCTNIAPYLTVPPNTQYIFTVVTANPGPCKSDYGITLSIAADENRGALVASGLLIRGSGNAFVSINGGRAF